MRFVSFVKKNIFGIIGAFVLTVFTVYALLDAFVIVRSYGAAQTAETTVQTEEGADTEAETSPEETAPSEPVVTSDSYTSDTVSVTLSEYRYLGTTIHVADVTVSDPAKLLTAFADDTYGKNVKDETSSIAEDNGAVIAINGDFYGSRNRGYVIRNGVLYRDDSAGNEDLVIWSDGTFGIIDEDDVTAEELLEQGAYQVFSFGPALIEDGSITVSQYDEVGRSMASNPRTAIAVVDSCHYLFIVSDGRTSGEAGLSLYELAEFAQTLGVDTCYNLDGGGSSTMYFMGEVVNDPTGGRGSSSERSVSDIVYVGE